MPPCRKGLSKLGNRPALPLRGGSAWGDAAGAGVFALYLSHPRAYQYATVGFRAALPSRPDASGLRAMRQCGGDKGACFPAVQKAKNKNLMEAVSNPPIGRANAVTHEHFTGTSRRFLCAAAIGAMVPGQACSRSTSMSRARTATGMLVSAPLYPHSQILKAHGPCFRAEGIKGLVSGLTPCGGRQKPNFMEAASSPLGARAVTHETYWSSA